MRRTATVLFVLAAAATDASGAGQPAKTRRTGESIYLATCAACHREGTADAPKVGDRVRWAPLVREGLKELTADAIKGMGAMPPKGGDPSLTADEIARAIVFMANRSGAAWSEPN